MMSKVCRWVKHIDVLSETALSQPLLANAALSRSLQHKWTFLLRVLQYSKFFRNLNCHSFLVSYLPCLVLKCLQ